MKSKPIAISSISINQSYTQMAAQIASITTGKLPTQHSRGALFIKFAGDTVCPHPVSGPMREYCFMINFNQSTIPSNCNIIIIRIQNMQNNYLINHDRFDKAELFGMQFFDDTETIDIYYSDKSKANGMSYYNEPALIMKESIKINRPTPRNRTCPICYESLDNSNNSHMILPCCNNAYHSECIHEYLKKSNCINVRPHSCSYCDMPFVTCLECPMCRTNVLKDNPGS